MSFTTTARCLPAEGAGPPSYFKRSLWGLLCGVLACFGAQSGPRNVRFPVVGPAVRGIRVFWGAEWASQREVPRCGACCAGCSRALGSVARGRVTRMFAGDAHVRWWRPDVGVLDRVGCRSGVWVSFTTTARCLPAEGAGPPSYFKRSLWGLLCGVLACFGAQSGPRNAQAEARPECPGRAFAVLPIQMFVSMSGQTTPGGSQCRLFESM
ncbi:hypothetical protein J2T10_002914 [Paenarthrobacter nicotinovorans]|uniref:Uncharacterized protein n=1 Tax=Paenarthrobacter nicotinovorans TaxID=29320 RepID=A0ABT9TNJ7_PAENI|nr:hypothetical protein [Paenarthrobacter nicotinovorans]